LASSLLPCVYPLIPVTVGYLQKRSADGARWLHPAVYWLGTVVAYTVLGTIAALTGGTFNALMQSGIVIVLTGFLFLFLVFVMLDWFPLSFSGGSRIVDRASRRNGVFFTFLMGTGAGLIASACVAPALFAMLIFIAKIATEGNGGAGTVLYGSLLSASFGAGLGVPFFLAGVLQAKLPRSGNWMMWVKYTFALLIAGAGFYQISKGFTVMEYSDMDISILILGVLLIFSAALLGLKPQEKKDPVLFTRFIFALLALAFGFSAVILGINPGLRRGSVHQEISSKKEVPPEVIAGLTFYRDVDSAFQIAEKENRRIFLDFYADWCTNCKEFYTIAEKNTELNRALSEAVIVKIYDTDDEFFNFSEQADFQELRIGLPFFAVLEPDGKTLIWKTTDYKDSRGMIRALTQK
ncbi:MAG: thioredoxin family protein, partial [Spirochaetia bacterium]|nr:thioredoxin family protein [Spirochaetia bacterium]